MRTTIDLPDDLHAIAGQLAQDRRTTLSQVVADLMRKALSTAPREGNAGTISAHPLTGFPTLKLGTAVITTEAVRQLQDDE